MGKAALVFDPSARKDFITGFHKRKVERKQKARQRISAGVRTDKLEQRKEKREQLKALRSGEAMVGAGGNSLTGAAPDGREVKVEGPARKPVAGDDDDPDAERATYDFEGMVATTVVSSLEPEPEPEPPRRRPADQRGLSAPRPKEKKFNLDVPLMTAIPGYKIPGGKKLPKSKKEKKRTGPIGKKEKAKHRGLTRAASRKPS